MLEKIEFDTEICRFNGVWATAVYLGIMTGLVDVTHKVKWHKGKCDGLDMELETTTLGELKEQFCRKIEIHGKEYEAGMITVVINRPLGGEIYQYGNYPGENCFRKIGTLAGYA